jgi:hypothetical protein
MIWTNLSISLCVMSVFYILGSELLLTFPKLDLMRGIVAAVLTGSGITAWFVGRHGARQRQRSETGGGTRVSLSLDLRYWGVMGVVLAALSFFVQPLRRRPEVSQPARPTVVAPPVVAEEVPVPSTTNPPVIFPVLNIQGFMLGQNAPVVIIDGRSYGEGDRVQGFAVKSITREGVVMEQDGETKIYKVE